MTNGQNYYDAIKSRDIVTLVKRLLQNAGYFMRDSDGKIDAERRKMWDTPWHHVRHHAALDCNLWHRVMFDAVSMQLPESRRFVPSPCQSCYKVVVRPGTIKQLFALLDLQKQLGKPSKCGIETRPTVHGLYGGYFYNIGLDVGVDCYKTVRAAVDAADFLGPDVPVFLKRACTEYEMECGPSNKWEITDDQLQIEALIEQNFVKDDVLREQSEAAILYVHRKWIEFAYMNGDPTYSEFSGGEPLYPPYITYNHLAEKDGGQC